MNGFLLDTNVISEQARKAPDPAVITWMSGLAGFAVSVITVEEIAFGLSIKPNARIARWVDRLFQNVNVLDISMRIARRSGELRARARLTGSTRSLADMLIAATTIDHDLVLATRNARDFEGLGVRLFNPWIER